MVQLLGHPLLVPKNTRTHQKIKIAAFGRVVLTTTVHSPQLPSKTTLFILKRKAPSLRPGWIELFEIDKTEMCSAYFFF